MPNQKYIPQCRESYEMGWREALQWAANRLGVDVAVLRNHIRRGSLVGVGEVQPDGAVSKDALDKLLSITATLGEEGKAQYITQQMIDERVDDVEDESYFVAMTLVSERELKSDLIDLVHYLLLENKKLKEGATISESIS